MTFPTTALRKDRGCFLSTMNPLRFDQWMPRALYDPQKGYYSRRIETVGGRGDFTTAPMISDHLAHAIGKADAVEQCLTP